MRRESEEKAAVSDPKETTDYGDYLDLTGQRAQQDLRVILEDLDCLVSTEFPEDLVLTELLDQKDLASRVIERFLISRFYRGRIDNNLTDAN